MDWQLLLVCLCIVLAACYLGRRAWRTWHPPQGGCCGGCGCAAKASAPAPEKSVTLIPVEQLTLRRRR